MDFYDLLLLHKSKKKLSYKDIGSVLNMTQAAARMAINRRSLSKLQIKEIANFFGFEKHKQDYTSNLDGEIAVKEDKFREWSLDEKIAEKVAEKMEPILDQFRKRLVYIQDICISIERNQIAQEKKMDAIEVFIGNSIEDMIQDQDKIDDGTKINKGA